MKKLILDLDSSESQTCRKQEGSAFNGHFGGTAEQWINEGQHALHWTRLSCHDFEDSAVRLQLFGLANNLGIFMHRLILPGKVKHWMQSSLREKLIKTGAKVIHHALKPLSPE